MCFPCGTQLPTYTWNLLKTCPIVTQASWHCFCDCIQRHMIMAIFNMHLADQTVVLWHLLCGVCSARLILDQKNVYAHGRDRVCPLNQLQSTPVKWRIPRPTHDKMTTESTMMDGSCVLCPWGDRLWPSLNSGSGSSSLGAESCWCLLKNSTGLRRF